LMMESWAFFSELLSWEMKNVEDVDVLMCQRMPALPWKPDFEPLRVSDWLERWWMLSTYPDSAETSCFVEKMNLLKRKTRKEDEDGWDVLMMKSCRWSGKMVVAEMKKWLLMILMSKKWLLKNLMSKERLLRNLLSKKICRVQLVRWSEVKWKGGRCVECVECAVWSGKKVEWRPELLFPVSKKVRKSENNSLFGNWQRMRKDSASWWVACRKSRAV
jgi:hypothetical protein